MLIDLGRQPVSNRFLADDVVAPEFQMRLMLDHATGIIYLEQPFPLDELKPRYDWLTCFEPEDHLDDLVEQIMQLPGLGADALVGAYSFKDQSTLDRLAVKGLTNHYVIDPEEDLGISDPCANVETYQSVFDSKKAGDIRAARGSADIFVVRHVVEHAYDLMQFVEAVDALVRPGGYIVWELPDCESAFIHGDCTTVWEEHIYYFTAFTFRNFLMQLGYTIDYFHSYPYALENSITAIVHRDPSTEKVVPDAAQLEAARMQASGFASRLIGRKDEVRARLKALSSKGRVAIFGAGHLTVAFVSILGVGEYIDVVLDDNENKIGKQLAAGNIPIHGSEALYDDVSVCLLGLNPQNQPKVVSKHSGFLETGGSFYTIFPETFSDDIKLL